LYSKLIYIKVIEQFNDKEIRKKGHEGTKRTYLKFKEGERET